MKDEMRLTPAALSAMIGGDLANALVAATPGGIERQEAQGQRDMAATFRTLPQDMDREPAKAFGFTFGDDEDELFVNVTAPEGWSISPTDHAMHSDILDDQGRVRGSIFYKAAFYDRRANGNWMPRYRVEGEYGEHELLFFKAVDTATNEELFKEAVPPRPADRDDLRAWYDLQNGIEKSVIAKLAAKFPDHANVKAYW